MPNILVNVSEDDFDLITATEGTQRLAEVLAAALSKAGGEISGNITCAAAETFDGRDLSVDGAKLDLIEAAADVTGDANVRAALAAATAAVDVNNQNILDIGRANVKIIRASFTEDTQYDNYNPTGLDEASILLLSPFASGNLVTGIMAPTANKDGSLLWVVNADRTSSGGVTLKDTDANSDEANRLQLPGTTDLVLNHGDAIALFYDNTSDRWRALDN